MKSSLPLALIIRLLVILSLIAVISPLAQCQVTFFTPPTYSGDGSPFVGDFNGDGKPDLYAGGTLQLGKGDGTFAAGITVPGVPLAFADFNGDGKIDILEQGLGTLEVLLGNGDGTFQTPVSTNSGASLTAVAAVDVDGDGKIDVLGVFNNTLLVYLGKGDGTFAAGVPYNLGAVASSALIVVGDFNGDKKTDVAVIIAGQVIVLLGNGDGTFQSPTDSAGVASPGSAVTGDFNRDGKLDLAISGGPPGTANCTPNVSLLLGNGDGTFQAPAAAFSGCGALAAADLNGDGKLDLVLSSNLIEIHLGNGDGTFSTARYYMPVVTLSPSVGAAIADFNLDGKLDIASGNYVLLGNGDGTFRGQPAVSLPLSATAAVAGDFDKNGTQDLAAISQNSANDVYILTNDGKGALTLAHTYTLQQPGYGIAAADLNGDGNLDLVIASTDAVTQNWGYSVLLGKGDGSFQSPVFYPQNLITGANAYSIVIADFNNDHRPDVALTLAGAGGSQLLAVLLGNGDGTFASPAYVFDGGGSSLVSADFNGDGKADLAAAGPAGIAILLGNGNGTFQPATFPFTSQYGGLLTADLNGDGKADLIAINNGTPQEPATPSSQVFLGNGDGTFKALSPGPASVMALADVNGDGKLDAIGAELAFSLLDYGVLLGNGDGTFGSFIPVISFPAGLAPSFVQTADMNGDGKPDLTFGQSSRVFVLLNTTPKSDFTISASALSPTSVTPGGSATSTITVTSVGGFNGSVAFSCSGLPSGANCSFNPSSMASASGTTVVTVTTASTMAAANRSGGIWLWPSFAIGLAFVTLAGRRRERWLQLVCGALLSLLLIAVLLSACGRGPSSGSNGGGGTPAGTYAMTVTASSTSGSTMLTHNTQLTLVVQ